MTVPILPNWRRFILKDRCLWIHDHKTLAVWVVLINIYHEKNAAPFFVEIPIQNLQASTMWFLPALLGESALGGGTPRKPTMVV